MPYKNVGHTEGGWSEWQWPVHQGYKMACCGCGLVHELEFEVARISRRRDGSFYYTAPVKSKRVRVKLRARRNERATAALRREKEKRDGKAVQARRGGARAQQAPRGCVYWRRQVLALLGGGAGSHHQETRGRIEAPSQ